MISGQYPRELGQVYYGMSHGALFTEARNSMIKKSMRKLVPFKLDPIFRSNLNPQIECSDCGKTTEFRVARIVAIDISEGGKGQPIKRVSLDEWFRTTTRAFLCPECWNREHHIEPKPGSIQ
jgi:hypothetical protein